MFILSPSHSAAFEIFLLCSAWLFDASASRQLNNEDERKRRKNKRPKSEIVDGKSGKTEKKISRLAQNELKPSIPKLFHFDPDSDSGTKTQNLSIISPQPPRRALGEERGRWLKRKNNSQKGKKFSHSSVSSSEWWENEENRRNTFSLSLHFFLVFHLNSLAEQMLSIESKVLGYLLLPEATFLAAQVGWGSGSRFWIFHPRTHFFPLNLPHKHNPFSFQASLRLLVFSFLLLSASTELRAGMGRRWIGMIRDQSSLFRDFLLLFCYH
jgi:hypothetical protein